MTTTYLIIDAATGDIWTGSGFCSIEALKKFGFFDINQKIIKFYPTQKKAEAAARMVGGQGSPQNAKAVTWESVQC